MSMSVEDRKTLHDKLIEYSKAHQFTKKREIFEDIIYFVDGLLEDVHDLGYEDGVVDGEERAMDSGGF